MQRLLTFSAHLRGRFGTRVQKIPLDAGFSCPNRDGTLSSTGCSFCNSRGSGTGLALEGLDLAGQWAHWRERLARKYRAELFIAYLQSFSNTHGPARRLAAVLEQLKDLPGLAGLAVGTRPDCLDREKLRLLAAFPARETWLELGLQSSHDETLRRINRGHDYACFVRAVEQAATLRTAAGEPLRICVHLIAGLPGETREHFLETVRRVNALPVHGVKFHNLYVCRHSSLAEDWTRGDFQPQSREEYVHWLARALRLLRPDMVVQRLTGDPSPGELLAPEWAADKAGLLQAIHQTLRVRDIRQGMDHTGDTP
jgi:hypothetical protein